MNYGDGISYHEAELVVADYFPKLVGLCGMPDTPQDRGEFWCVHLWGGIVPVDYGRLWLAKDGSKLLLEPPRKGFTTSTKYHLQRLGISYD